MKNWHHVTFLHTAAACMRMKSHFKSMVSNLWLAIRSDTGLVFIGSIRIRMQELITVEHPSII